LGTAGATPPAGPKPGIELVKGAGL
jgi:hypothetical protein